MGKRVSYRHNRDGSVTRTTTYSGKTLFGTRTSHTFSERMPAKKSHSFLLHLILCAVVIGLITIPYYTLSSKHCWRLI